MKKLTVNEIREMWIDFFKKKSHLFVEPKSLIPNNDNSLLWINSGIATLKKYFEGSQIPPSKKIVNVQKALRTNDLENVGQTARHHTFFEMLGNFSIGDYFKKEAIEMAWELLTSKEYFDLDPNLLYITIYEKDNEAKSIWLDEIGIKKDHLIECGKKTNYWDIGKGPCGPSTEIWFDRGKKYDTKNIGIKSIKNDLENDRYIEIWNIVFSQYNNDGKGNYTELPRKNIDTGAGLERLASVFQSTVNNFEIDTFKKIINKIEEYTKVKYQFGKIEQPKQNKDFKIIADHLRAIVFTLADGAIPSNIGRGYVIRRLIRRAINSSVNIKIQNFDLLNLLPTLIEINKQFYPYLESKKNEIESIIKVEQDNYYKLLESSKTKLNDYLSKNKLDEKGAFYLFETYGYPFDLINQFANENKIKLDKVKFDKIFQKHQQKAKDNKKDADGIKEQNKHLINANITQEFVGYDKLNQKQAKVIYLMDNNLNKVNSIKNKGIVIFDKTPFYAKSGGQRNDIGVAKNKLQQFNIINVEKGTNQLFYHYIEVDKGVVKLGDFYDLSVNKEIRKQTTLNHSSTHLIFAALEELLNSSLPQVGSENDENKLRFDFAYTNKLPEDINKLAQKKVNSWIKKDYKRNYVVTNIETAKKSGATYMQDENYDEIVRIVDFEKITKDFCGGTHVNSTGEIGEIKLLEIKTQANGVYRVIAYSGKKQINSYFKHEIAKWKEELDPTIKKINSLKLTDKKSLNKEIEKGKKIIANLNNDLTDENLNNYIDAKKTLSKIYNEFNNYKVNKEIDDLVDKYSKKLKGNLNDKNYIVEVKEIPANNLKTLAVELQNNKNISDKIIALFSTNDNKTSFIITKNNEFNRNINIMQELNKVRKNLKINGGGNPNWIQGVSNISDLNKFIESL